jgi:hypothetical protein
MLFFIVILLLLLLFSQTAFYFWLLRLYVSRLRLKAEGFLTTRKKESSPITGLDRPRGFQEVEASRFQENRHMKVSLPPRKYSWYSFLLEAESTPGPQCGRKDYVNEKFQWHPSRIEPTKCAINRIRTLVPVFLLITTRYFFFDLYILPAPSRLLCVFRVVTKPVLFPYRSFFSQQTRINIRKWTNTLQAILLCYEGTR